MSAALSSVLLTALACFGGGAYVLKALKLWDNRGATERAALAFACGFGLVGWLTFWLGLANGLTAIPVQLMCFALATGCVAFRTNSPRNSDNRTARSILWLLGTIALIAVSFDILEAIAPPVDADSLAYHFHLPRMFVEAGGIFFIPRALDGAAPMLVHMTHAAVLALGGDTLGLTLWMLVSGWGASLLLFALLHRWLPLGWSFAVALTFQTVPAMTFGAGSGQVEARLALFTLLAAAALIECKNSRSLGPAVLLGLACGFYGGAKFTGLLFMAAGGIGLLACGQNWFKRGAVFAAVTLVAAGQWYAYLWVHSGDPLFPMLFSTLGLPDSAIWTADAAAKLRDYLDFRGTPTQEFHWLFTYPFIATFDPPGELEAGRVGLGPFAVLVLPATLLGLWQCRSRILKSPLLPIAVTSAAFYFLWMVFGGFHKVRHLLPVLPLLFLCFSIAALNGWAGAKRGVFLALVLSIALNLAAQGLFSKSYAARLIKGESDEAFLGRTLSGYRPVIPAINARTDIKKILVFERQLRYHIRAESFMGASLRQIAVSMDNTSAEKLMSELHALGISHILATKGETEIFPPHSIGDAIENAIAKGCLVEQQTFTTRYYGSRTVGNVLHYRTAKLIGVQPNC